MAQLRKIFQHDSYLLGISVAILTTTILLLILMGIRMLLPDFFNSHYLRKQVLILVSIFINLFAFRYFMLSKKFDRTGRGILLAVFVMTISYFVFLYEE
ncbi:MAG: hypothetical protein U1C46_07985 [Bacteroidales bacterium]|nr:hypothetical protein [Bacteroidales bacterium]